MQVNVVFTVQFEAGVEVDDDEYKEWKGENHPGRIGKTKMLSIMHDFLNEDAEGYLSDAVDPSLALDYTIDKVTEIETQ